jgi:hypothetical protein
MKSLAALAAAIILLAFGACKGPGTTRQPAHQPTTVTTPDKPSTQPAPSKTTAQAIADGISFLRKAPWEFDFVYLYGHLQPRYHWPELPAQRHHAFIKDSLRQNGDQRALNILDQMTIFERLLNPAYQLPREKMAFAQETDAFIAPALYCDLYPLDTATYFPTLRREAAAGGYSLSHTLLAYLWLSEKSCLPPPQLQAIRTRLVQENRAMLETMEGWWDLKIEVAALLRAVGEAVPEAWTSEIIAAQQPDGGWREKPQDQRSNTHATILALWFLALD